MWKKDNLVSPSSDWKSNSPRVNFGDFLAARSGCPPARHGLTLRSCLRILSWADFYKGTRYVGSECASPLVEQCMHHRATRDTNIDKQIWTTSNPRSTLLVRSISLIPSHAYIRCAEEPFGASHHPEVHQHGAIKYTSKGVLLEPQPSDDTHDPLNFPAWQKVSILIILAYWAFLGTCNLIIVVGSRRCYIFCNLC